MRFAMLICAGALFAATPALAEIKVELKKVHMCCEGCAEEVENTLKKVAGITTVTTDQKTTSTGFTATDAKSGMLVR